MEVGIAVVLLEGGMLAVAVVHSVKGVETVDLLEVMVVDVVVGGSVDIATVVDSVKVAIVVDSFNVVVTVS